MMSILSLSLGAAGAATALVALGVLNHLRTPPWAGDISTPWRRINSYSSLVGMLCGIFALLPVALVGIAPMGALATCLGTTALGYCLTQACFTDPPLHLVDRYTLNLAGALSLGTSFLYLYGVGDKVMLGGFMAFALAAGALILLPLGIGASDGRAFLLAVGATFPLLGFELIKYPLIAMFACFLAYGAWNKFSHRSKGDSIAEVLLSRTHIPAVPFILAPFLLGSLGVMAWSLLQR